MIVEDAGCRKWGEQMPRTWDADREKIKQLAEAMLKSAGGLSRFKKALPLLLREAIDEVIDAPRTNRSGLNQTKMNERTYLAAKVRLRLRNLLKLPRGRTLDIFANGTDVAIQSTICQTWRIPRGVVGSPCVLVKADPARSVCSVGAIMIRDESLSQSTSPSGRKMISIAGLAGVRWILKDEPLPDPTC